MSSTSLRLRRTLTLVLAVGALLLGYGAVRAASAWTAEAAPLVVSPTAASEIEARLSAEQSRSADLEQQIAAMTAQADEMTSALQVAQDRITSDGAHADQLSSGSCRGQGSSEEARGVDQSRRRTTDGVGGQDDLVRFDQQRHDPSRERRRPRR